VWHHAEYGRSFQAEPYTRTLVRASPQIGVHRGSSRLDDSCLTLYKHALRRVGYHAEVDRCLVK